MQPSPDRPLGLSESFFHFMHAMGAFVVCITVRGRGPLRAAHLRDAAARLQERHPLLRVHFVTERGVTRFCEEGTARIPVREIARTSDASFEDAVRDELARPLPDGPTPALRLTLVTEASPSDASRFELLLAMDHAVCDGASVISIVRDLLADCGRLAAGKELADVVPMAPLASVEALVRAGAAARAPAAKRNADDEKQDIPLLAPKAEASRGARGTRLFYRGLTTDEATALSARCRAARTSVNGALTAAALLAVARVTNRASKLGVQTNVALRASTVPPVSESQVGNFVSYVQTFHDVAPDACFWELARASRDSIAAKIAAREPEGRLADGQLVWWQRGFLRHVAPRIRGGVGNAVAVSNSGRLELARTHGPLTLDAVYGASSQHVIGSAFAVWAWSVADALHVCTGCPEPLVDGAAAERVTDMMMSLLRSPPPEEPT